VRRLVETAIGLSFVVAAVLVTLAVAVGVMRFVFGVGLAGECTPRTHRERPHLLLQIRHGQIDQSREPVYAAELGRLPILTR
jgi:hypothetical protein